MVSGSSTEKISHIHDNLLNILQRISDAEKKAGRNPGSVKLLCVSKFHPEEAVVEAVKCGQLYFGENRVQEASLKFPKILQSNPEVKLHLIGQLQTNKVKNAVMIADTIQSVDRLDLILEIEKQAAKINKEINILLELHTGEESKSGFENVQALREALLLISSGKTPHVVPKGFMTMAPFTEDQNAVRSAFITLRQGAQELKKEFPQFELNELSMGMSGDFEIAIEEGSTMVRIGTAIFGERQY